jgi:uncharacterized tellurite resistance protein B-like protein
MSTDTQAQSEALVNLMLAARYADNKISLSEGDAMQKLLDELPWSSGTALSLYVQQATAAVRRALAGEATRQSFVETQCGRFRDPSSRKNVIRGLESLLQADGLDPTESKLLQQIRGLFQM